MGSVTAATDYSRPPARPVPAGRTTRWSRPAVTGPSHQPSDLDLSSKALAWEDAAGMVWVGYTAPADLVARYQIGNRADAVQKMTGVLDVLTTQATRL